MFTSIFNLLVVIAVMAVVAVMQRSWNVFNAGLRAWVLPAAAGIIGFMQSNQLVTSQGHESAIPYGVQVFIMLALGIVAGITLMATAHLRIENGFRQVMNPIAHLVWLGFGVLAAVVLVVSYGFDLHRVPAGQVLGGSVLMGICLALTAFNLGVTRRFRAEFTR